MSLAHALEALKANADEVVETSCATVILKGDKAYKLKRDVDYGFLDFTTANKRRTALLKELELNQRTAGDIYREVIELHGESVLVMRRFDMRAVLAEQSATMDDWVPDLDLMQDLGEAIAEFHAASPICRDEFHASNIKYTIDSNTRTIALFRDELGAEAIDAYESDLAAAYAALGKDVRLRFETGGIRHCHGDLHLGNILIEDGRPVLFDCIEFNEHLMQVDVLYDLGFLLMDLWVRGHHAAANRVMNAWLDRMARLEGEAGLYAGLKLLPFYMSVRAGIRCHVAACNDEMDKARMYLGAARDFLRDVPANVWAIGGLSGSGKSTRGRMIAAQQGRPPGAVLLRSDELRKRLWKWPAYEALPKEAYAPEQSVRTYEHIFVLGQEILNAGQSVIFDATFREKRWRDAAGHVAVLCEAPFNGLWLDVSAQERRQRVDARIRDVSDATGDVALQQEAVDLQIIDWAIERATSK